MLNIKALDPNNQLTQTQKHHLALSADRLTTYFRFTGTLARCKPNPGGGGFLYPKDSLLVDMSFLWTCLCELHAVFKNEDKLDLLVDAVKADPYSNSQLQRIVEGDPQQRGYYWTATPSSGPPARSLPFASFQNSDYKGLLQLLRNGYSHFRWQFTDRTASDYFQEMKWTGGQAPSDFPQQNAYNHTLYIADADSGEWKLLRNKGKGFWLMSGLRVLATPAHLLRYHLHALLNFLLVSQKVDVFGNTL
jgi:hypothetical protein